MDQTKMKTTLPLLLLSLASAAGQNKHLTTTNGEWFLMTNAPSGIVFSNPHNFVLLGGYVTTNFLTNATEHWPQKQDGMRPNPGYDAWAANKHMHPYTLEYCPPEIPNYVDDLNADTKTVETTVTRQRLLSFGFEQRKFEEVLTNETVAHFSVEYRRVRTNVWFLVKDMGILEWDGDPNFKKLRFVDNIHDKKDPGLEALCETNWFEPVRTNKLWTVESVGGSPQWSATNIETINVLTNFTPIWK